MNIKQGQRVMLNGLADNNFAPERRLLQKVKSDITCISW